MPKSIRKIKEIYLDHASLTPTDDKVLGVFVKTMREGFGNASGIHQRAVTAKKILTEARKKIADILHSKEREIVFTSGATQSNNLAIQGVVKHFDFLPHVITTNIEHPSVLEVCKNLENEKRIEATYLKVGESGIIDPQDIKKAVKKNTVLVSVMYANNEIGTIQPIGEISKVIRSLNKDRDKKIIFHTDATQAVNYLPVEVDKLGVDMMSQNGGKIYGPKGIGVLFVKKDTPIDKIFFGGDQEGGLYPGTENVAAASALAEALSLVQKMKEKEVKRLFPLRDYFIKKLFASRVIKKFGLIINGDPSLRLPNNINITIPKIPSELLVLELSARGIYVSEKSSCKSDDVAPSHVISALRDKDLESIRFSLGRSTQKKDLDVVIKALEEILTKLIKWYN